MSRFTLIQLLALMMILGACASGHPPGNKASVMTIPAISTSLKAPLPAKGRKLPPVETRFCSGDAPMLERHGFLDEVTKQVLKQYRARYILNVTVKPEGDCVVLRGTPIR